MLKKLGTAASFHLLYLLSFVVSRRHGERENLYP